MYAFGPQVTRTKCADDADDIKGTKVEINMRRYLFYVRLLLMSDSGAKFEDSPFVR